MTQTDTNTNIPAEPTSTKAESRVIREMHELINERRTLILATVDESGMPDASYAPFVRSERGGFLVYVSEIARHTANLLKDRKTSVMLIEDEGEADQTYAHRRLTLPCGVEVIERGSEAFRLGMERLQQRHGDIIQNIGRMIDFHLLELSPSGPARLVLGFGRAYDVAGEGLDRIEHLNGRGATGGHRIAGHRVGDDV